VVGDAGRAAVRHQVPRIDEKTSAQPTLRPVRLPHGGGSGG